MWQRQTLFVRVAAYTKILTGREVERLKFPAHPSRSGAARQLARLITWRSQVQILPPPLAPEPGPTVRVLGAPEESALVVSLGRLFLLSW